MKRIETRTHLDDLRKILFFRFVGDREINDVADITEVYGYPSRATIISEGELDPHIYAVIKGTVNVLVREASGKEVFICAIGEGDVFGEAGMFLNVRRTAHIVTAEDTILLRIHRDAFLKFIKNHPGPGMKMLMLIIYSLIKKLRDANQEIAFERKSDISQEDIDTIISDFVYKN